MIELPIPEVNNVIVAGRLGRDPELRHSANETPYCLLSVANSRHYKGTDGQRKKTSAYINLTLWGPQTRWAAENLSKGDPVIVRGKLQSNEWEKNGIRNRELTINATAIELIGEKA